MKKTLFAIICSVCTISSVFAQPYPLPSTEIYGSLTVQDAFVDTNNGWYLANDSLDLVSEKIPQVGAWKQFGSGLFLNTIGDWSTRSGEPMEGRLGFFALNSQSGIRIDTNDITIAGYDLNIEADSVFFYDTSVEYISMGASGNASLNAGQTATVTAVGEVYLTANQQDADNWEYGYSAFSNDSALCCNGTATMFALREDYLLDVQSYYLDSLKMSMSSRYGVAGASNYNRNDFVIDSTGFNMYYGLGNGSWTPANQGTITLNEAASVTANNINLVSTGTDNFIYQNGSEISMFADDVLQILQGNLDNGTITGFVIDSADGGVQTFLTTANNAFTVYDLNGPFVRFQTSIDGQTTINGELKLNNSTVANGAVLTSDASGNSSWQIGPTSDVVIVDEEADFGTAVGNVYTLTANTIYMVLGEVTLTNSIDCNGAILLGRDRTVDKLTSSQNNYTMFVNDGSIISENITYSVTGTSSSLFNIKGTTTFEYIYMQDCTFASNTRLGEIDSVYAVQFINIPNQSPTGSLILDDVFNISLRGFDFTNSTADTSLVISGVINLIQIYESAWGVASGDIGLDITGITSIASYASLTAGSGFTGAGTYLNGTPSVEWEIDARGLQTQTDETANMAYYISSSSATTISTVNTWTKVAGTTTAVNAFRFDDDSGTSNRARYLGTQTVDKQINVSLSATSANNNKVYEVAIYKYDDSAASGAIATQSIQSRKIATGADVGQFSITALIEMDTNDYVEVHIRNVTDTDNPTVEYMNLSIN